MWADEPERGGGKIVITIGGGSNKLLGRSLSSLVPR